MNKYELMATGSQEISQDPIIQRVQDKHEKKKPYYEERLQRRNEIKTTMEFVLPLAKKVIENTGAKQVGEMEELYYASGILHQAWNFLSSTKLFPDYIDYESEITVDPVEKLQVERNASLVMSFARRKGEYDKSVNKARNDLIYGESFMYRDYEVNEDGVNKKLKWEHIPWEEVRIPYDDEDWIIIRNWSKDAYVTRYGEKMLKKVTCGKLLETDLTENSFMIKDPKKDEEVIQEVIYLDPSQKVFAKIHGSNGYIFLKLEGEKYPFIDSDGTPFVPIKKRVFYEPPYGYHGWGPLDFLLPTAKLDTIITNASANRAVLEADPLIVMATNDPEAAKRMFSKYKRNRSRGQTEPFFVSDTNTGTRIAPQNVSLGANNGNFKDWKEQMVQDATMRTGIDFRVLTEFAPTAEQQRLRKMEEDKMNLGVLMRNADTDRAMAQEDLYILKNTTSEFHNITVYLEPMRIHTEGMTEEEKLLMEEDNEMIKIPMTVAEFFEYLENVEFTVSPRLEGALDNSSYLEMVAMKENLMLIPQGTEGYNKALIAYLGKTSPQYKIKKEDLIPPQPEQPPVTPQPNAGMPI